MAHHLPRRALVAAGALAVASLLLPVSPAAAAGPTTTRLGGTDRFDTAAKVSATYFSPGVPVAFVADGDAFPDALSAGPAATALGGPVLLTHPATLPSSTTTELTRLHPQKIVVVGGTAAISASVKDQLAGFTNGQVVRVSGVDRFDTSAQISAFAFGTGAGTAIIATGEDFPDALSGGSAAGPAAGPVLLVRRDSIPTSVSNELSRLHNANGFTSIVVIGGPAAISDAVFQALQNGGYAPSVLRRDGVDRFDTSVTVSKASYSTGATTAFLASGVAFPDALAAIPPSGLKGFPILLTDPSCVPNGVLAELTRLGVTSVVVLGGTAATSNAVLNLTPC
jgi:putative cell wall-binding protein